jgi:hypothetical protein
MKLRQKNVYINVLNQGTINTDLVKVLNTIIQQDGYRIGLNYPHSKPITNNRNQIVQKFLAQKEYDYLMMIDSDIVPPPNILKLLDFQKDIITPLMFVMQRGELLPLYLRMHKDGMYDFTRDYLERTGLVEVDATGTGCIILSRKVLESIKHPFRNEYDSDGIKKLGNDLSFCKRAKEKGFKVYVHLDYVADHITSTSLKELHFLLLQKENAEKQLFQLKEHFKDKPEQLEKILSSPQKT